MCTSIAYLAIRKIPDVVHACGEELDAAFKHNYDTRLRPDHCEDADDIPLRDKSSNVSSYQRPYAYVADEYIWLFCIFTGPHCRFTTVSNKSTTRTSNDHSFTCPCAHEPCELRQHPQYEYPHLMQYCWLFLISILTMLISSSGMTTYGYRGPIILPTPSRNYSIGHVERRTLGYTKNLNASVCNHTGRSPRSPLLRIHQGRSTGY